MSSATSSTRSVIITKSLCPRISWACSASCTLMAPSSPTLELRGREHSNCMSWAQRIADPKLTPPGNEAFGLFVRRMGSYNFTSAAEERFREITRDVRAEDVLGEELRYARARDKGDK